MSFLHAIDGGLMETLTQATARRLRGELAERNISKAWLAETMGVSKMWLSRRTKGDVALSTDDLALIEQHTGISAAYLVTGLNKKAPGPYSPGGGVEGQYWPEGRGPKLGPSDYYAGVSNVIPLFITPAIRQGAAA